MSSRFYLSLLLLSMWQSMCAQNSPGLKSFISPSPDASALGKFGEIPVGNYTGIPSIGVPIYNIKSRELDLSVSLNYHAGGVRLQEIASSVGIGWSLNAGGMITRTVRGMPDDYRGGVTLYSGSTAPLAKNYLDNPNPVQSFFQTVGNAQTGDLTSLEQIRTQQVDGEPDLFSFNFGKYSGTFFVADNGQFIVSPAQALKIQYGGTNGVYAPHDVAQWILTTPDGVKYYFGTSANASRSAIERNDNAQPWPTVTSWHLLDIVSPNNDQINLDYDYISYNYVAKGGDVINIVMSSIGGSQHSLPGHDTRLISNNMVVPKIKSITSASGKISFTFTNSRTDLPGESLLSTINVFSNADLVNPLKKYGFTYDYSTGRLTLKNIQETSVSSIASGNTYQFEYNTPVLPAIPATGTAINSQDLWGYYNGVSTNSYLAPTVTITPAGYPAKVFTGADRHADETSMKAGSLKKIIYPTGGYTLFDYEANTVYSTGVSGIGIPDQPTTHVGSINFNKGETQSANFTVANALNGTATVSITTHAQTSGCTISPITGLSECYDAYIQGVSPTVYSAHYVPDGVYSLNLPNGTYQMVGIGKTGTGTGPTPNHFYFNIQWDEYPTGDVAGNKIIGGLRTSYYK